MVIINEDLTYEERTMQYEEYLEQHISGVQRSYEEIIRPWLVSNEADEFVTNLDIQEMDRRIEYHDQSKWDAAEYDAYLDHFYPADGSGEHDDESHDYKLAWLHHQHVNPHHWQHWLLLHDTSHAEDDVDRIEALEMDMFSVIEMLCDWSAFQYYRPGSTANKWYKENGDKMVFNTNTRAIVEQILEKFPNL